MNYRKLKYYIRSGWIGPLFVLLAACSSDEGKQALQSETDYPDQESWQATVLITKEARTVGKLQAGHVQKFSKKGITLLGDSLTVDFFNPDGGHTSVLYAQGGKVFDVRQDMIAYGKVKVVSDSGLTLFTDTLRWDNKAQKIISDRAMMIVSDEGDTLFGDYFKSNPAMTDYEITNPRGKSSKRLQMTKEKRKMENDK